MICPPSQSDILIVGAGPVGMLLALMLHQSGHQVVVVDKRTSIHPHSRAIGIHPPSLGLLHKAGLVDSFIERGRFIHGGWAFVDGVTSGQMRFDGNPGMWKYPLVVPQNVTEEILQNALSQRGIPIFWGWDFSSLEQSTDHVSASVAGPGGVEETITIRLVVGCDGKRSTVRDVIRSSFQGGQYRDRYLMADFDDDAALGDQAIINLHKDGLVECFPLPNAKRRWVARLSDHDTSEPDVGLLIRIIRSRFSEPVQLENPVMLSAFGIERYKAEKVVSGRVALAGDAAHVVSPIGGQGMNLGWMDSADLAGCLQMPGILERLDVLEARLAEYGRHVNRRAAKGIRRAWFNTMMGRPGLPIWIKSAGVRSIVNTGMQKVFARRFTMLDL